MDKIQNLTKGQLKENAPEVTVGATVKVYVKIREGENLFCEEEKLMCEGESSGRV